MNELEEGMTQLMVTFATTQPPAARTQIAELVIVGLLVALAIGGFAM